MKLSTRFFLVMATLGLADPGGAPLGATAQLTAPALIASSLKRFAHDDADMERRVESKAYERLAKEQEDFAKDADLLRAAIRGEPAPFQRRIEARIQRVLTASGNLILAGETGIDTDVRHALNELQEAVRKLNAEFPESVRSSA